MVNLDFIKQIILETLNKLQAAIRVERGALVLKRDELNEVIFFLDKEDADIEDQKKKITGVLEASSITFTVEKI